ncbi:hypothetical protein PENTCL1PPCAC_30382 [Pristionchus entomophagus]|uniref:Fork-head domain-containing protein n=1 Tax=Pristionchus entomophagus TaxID=358040 RepID=A0AAV5UNG7_9BILA|nr:hypothetical protein PENTCL1PPCAC_30382 [Pristionchus entomophagus]
MDGSSLLGANDEGWDLTSYAGNLNSNSNSNSSFTGLDWINKVDLSKFREEITPDIQKYKKPSPQKVESCEKRPSWSYSNLVALALKSSATGQLAVSDIYTFICEHFPYFRTAPPGWKNSVRHNLSLNKTFHKIELKPESHGRKSCLWSIRPEKQAKVNADLAKWREKEYAEETEAIEAEVDEDASPSLPKSPMEKFHKYVYTPRERTQRLSDFSIKTLTDKMSHSSKSTVSASKSRPAILSRTNAKRPISSVIPDTLSAPTPCNTSSANSCWEYSFGCELLSSPTRAASPTLSSLNIERSAKRTPNTPSKNVPINLFDMISPNPKSNSGLFSSALTDNSLLECTLAASPYKGPTTFPSSLSF